MLKSELSTFLSTNKMTLDQFLSLIATIFGALGSIYVLKSILRLTPEITENLSATRYGHNLDQVDSLSSQKAESVMGTILIIIALVIAIVNSAVMPINIIICDSRLWAVLFSFFLSIIVYLLLLFIGKTVNSNHRLSTVRIIVSEQLDRLFKKKSIPLYEIKSLEHMDERYFHLRLKAVNMTNIEFLQLIANYIGRTVPQDIQIEDESK